MKLAIPGPEPADSGTYISDGNKAIGPAIYGGATNRDKPGTGTAAG
jgi:hypothetical protein